MIMIMIMIIIIIMYCNNFNAKYWAIVGPKLSGPPDYRGPEYRGATVLNYEQGVSV